MVRTTCSPGCVGAPGQAEGPVRGARSAVAQGWELRRKSEHGHGSQQALHVCQTFGQPRARGNPRHQVRARPGPADLPGWHQGAAWNAGRYGWSGPMAGPWPAARQARPARRCGGPAMTGSGDYYEVLGVPRDADTKTIKNAFRQLARRYHPDTSTEPDAEQRFKEIAEAYGVLSDPAKRASYDAQGSAGLAGATAEDLWGGIDFTDIFGSGAAAFGSLFERLFGPPAAGRPRGQDVHLDLVISLEEVLTGGTQEVTIRRPGPCPRCAGSGSRPGTAPRRCPGCGGTGQRAVASRHGPLMVRQVITCPECAGRGRVIDQPCPACEASGRALREEKVTIRIPPGIPEGAMLRLAGRGMPSPVPGGPPGDAYASIRTRPDPRFTRDGADLWHDLHIQAPDAALGVTAAVPVPGGRRGSGCHREPSPAACCGSRAGACRAMAGTAAAA